MVVTTIIFYSVGVEIIQESKALHRLCGQRGVEDSKRANICPLILFLGFLETIFNGEGVIWTQNWPQYSSVILEIKDQTAEKDSILYYTKSENVILSAP